MTKSPNNKDPIGGLVVRLDTYLDPNEGKHLK